MKRILLHCCCAPCACHVADVESAGYDVSLFFYNPNIAPSSEYEKRRNELIRFSSLKNIPYVEKKPDRLFWTRAVKPFAMYGERSPRCWICYRLRMKEAFIYAAENGFDCVGTVLSISPHKDAQRINEIGRDLSVEYRIPFREADYKKKEGFKKAAILSAEYGFYRQDYCGCVYSILERRKNSSWYEQSLAFRRNMHSSSDQN